MDTYGTTNIAVVVACIILLVCYHLWLLRVNRTTPERTVYGSASHGRKAWVAAIMKGKKDILAVQSLRNLIMASSILASTCVAIVFGFIAFLATVVSHPDSTGGSNPLSGQFGFVLDQLFGAKVMALLVIFCVSFFCFAQSMRFYNHVGLVININLTAEELEESLDLNPQAADSDNGDEEHDDAPEIIPASSQPLDQNGSSSGLHLGPSITVDSPVVSRQSSFAKALLMGSPLRPVDVKSVEPTPSIFSDKLNMKRHHDSPSRRRERHLTVHQQAANIHFVANMLNRGSAYYTMGMRGYYISFPVMAYLWGPWALLGTTVLLVGILRVVDFNLGSLSPSHPVYEGSMEHGTVKADVRDSTSGGRDGRLKERRQLKDPRNNNTSLISRNIGAVREKVDDTVLDL